MLALMDSDRLIREKEHSEQYAAVEMQKRVAKLGGSITLPNFSSVVQYGELLLALPAPIQPISPLDDNDQSEEEKGRPALKSSTGPLASSTV